MKKKYFLALIFLLNTIGFGQSNVRLMSYNLANYPNSRSGDVDISMIEPYYKKIINSINPDILIVVEMLTQDGVSRFKQNVLGDEYGACPVEIKGNGIGGNDCAMFYRVSKFNFINTEQIATLTRDICEFTIVHRETNDTLIIYGAHLKANELRGDNSPNLIRRAAEVDSLRKRTLRLKSTANYLAAGDFNILDSGESAFIKLLDSSSPGYFYDPLQSFGVWNNNSSFANTHTYSPTKLATRFDLILLSQAVIEEGGVDYNAGSFMIFGNDANHFNKSVLDGSNYWFTDNYDLGLAATLASDHLPIYADFSFGVNASNVENKSTVQKSFALEQNYPNPFNPETTISYYLPANGYVTLKIYDLLGREIASLVNEFQNAGFYNSQFSTLNLPAGKQGSKLSSGVYFYQLTSGDFIRTKKMLLVK